MEDVREARGRMGFAVRKRVRRVMWERVGIIRTRESLLRALDEFERIAQAQLSRASRNFLTVAQLVARAALWREESRGAHFRRDFPHSDDRWRAHSVQRKGEAVKTVETIDFGEARSRA
jgi:L-aspartate oxidase